MSSLFKNLKLLIRRVKYRFLTNFHKNELAVSWDKGYNFGDAINPILIEKITQKKVWWVHRKYYPYTYLMCIGSILQKANSNTIVWGTGFISEEAVLDEKPQKICAVRGPKTRQKLLEYNVQCPEIYGDPALLLPLFYMPKIDKKYKLGIIPHYVDKKSILLDKFRHSEEILIIDIKQENHFNFIDQLLSCEKIVSSSLHGVITADAYSIPSMWIELSKEVKGNGFKFLDYFQSVKRSDNSPYIVKENTSFESFMKLFYEYEIKIDLNKLIDAFPYATILEGKK